MAKTYITSDLHFCHKNIIQYSPWSRGHYNSVNEMNEAIVSNINQVVTDDDTLIIAGDICFGGHDETTEFLKRINGYKKLVWGNHDKKYRNSTPFHSQKMLMGVVWEGDYLEFDHKFQEKKYKIVVNHFPFLTWDRSHHGSINLHGHCHSHHNHRNLQGMNVRQLDVGLDGNFMMPHDMDDICSEMSRRSIQKHGHHDGTKD